MVKTDFLDLAGVGRVADDGELLLERQADERIACRSARDRTGVHSHFVADMFLSPKSLDEYKRFVRGIHDRRHGLVQGRAGRWQHRSATRSSAFVREEARIIGNTAYAGEIKKSVFTILNYLCRWRALLVDALLGRT